MYRIDKFIFYCDIALVILATILTAVICFSGLTNPKLGYFEGVGGGVAVSLLWFLTILEFAKDLEKEEDC